MKYVYTLSNIKVFLLSCYLRKKGKPKFFRLLGKSGSGKSTFVKEFVDKRNDCLLIRGETMRELFFDYLSGVVLLLLYLRILAI